MGFVNFRCGFNSYFYTSNKLYKIEKNCTVKFLIVSLFQHIFYILTQQTVVRFYFKKNKYRAGNFPRFLFLENNLKFYKATRVTRINN